jgi:hypothetical protein
MATRVIQWGTGNTGRFAVQAFADHPELELVAVRVYDPAKAGRDAGEVCGTGPIGVFASDDRAAIIALDADVVLYMGSVETDPEGCFRDVIELLGSGKNVITTGTSFIDPRALPQQVSDAMAQACDRGHSSFLGLGLFPGYIGEVLIPALSRLSLRYDRLIVREVMSYATYPSHDLIFDSMGYGYAPDDPSPLLNDTSLLSRVWAGSIAVIAEAMGLDVGEITPFRETVVTPRELHVAAGTIPAGTVGAMRIGVRADCGKAEIVIDHITRMADDLAPHWPSDPGHSVELHGRPSMRCLLTLGIDGEPHSEQGCIATAMHAIHAIPVVVDAKPGLLNLAAIPPFVGGVPGH